MNRKPPRRRR